MFKCFFFDLNSKKCDNVIQCEYEVGQIVFRIHLFGVFIFHHNVLWAHQKWLTIFSEIFSSLLIMSPLYLQLKTVCSPEFDQFIHAVWVPSKTNAGHNLCWNIQIKRLAKLRTLHTPSRNSFQTVQGISFFSSHFNGNWTDLPGDNLLRCDSNTPFRNRVKQYYVQRLRRMQLRIEWKPTKRSKLKRELNRFLCSFGHSSTLNVQCANTSSWRWWKNV